MHRDRDIHVHVRTQKHTHRYTHHPSTQFPHGQVRFALIKHLWASKNERKRALEDLKSLEQESRKIGSMGGEEREGGLASMSGLELGFACLDSSNANPII